MKIGRYDFPTAEPSVKSSINVNTAAATGTSDAKPASLTPAKETISPPASNRVTASSTDVGTFSGVLSTALAEKSKVDGIQSSLENAQKSGDKAKLKKASEDFEAVFLNMMFKQMRSTIGDGGLMEKSYGRGVYEDMYYDELSKNISKGKGYGLGDLLYKDMARSYGTGADGEKSEEKNVSIEK